MMLDDFKDAFWNISKEMPPQLHLKFLLFPGYPLETKNLG
jgi:hypothetical protein